MLKHPNIEEKNRIEKRIENLQNKTKISLNKEKDKNKKSIQFELISDNIIDKLLDLGLFYMDIVYSLSIFFQTTATTQINRTENENKNSNKNESSHKNDNGSTIISKNILSLSILFSNFDFSTAGLFLSENTGKSVILVFQFLYEEVRRRFCTFFFVTFDFDFNSII